MGVSRSESEWEQLLREQGVSGLTIKEFCRARGISKSSFYKQRMNKGGDNEGDGKEVVELVPKSTTSSYEVIVNGVTVKIPNTEWATRIADLVRATIDQNPLSGHLFVFLNRDRNYMKVCMVGVKDPAKGTKFKDNAFL